MDKLALDKEKQALMDENHQLKALLKQYLDGVYACVYVCVCVCVCVHTYIGPLAHALEIPIYTFCVPAVCVCVCAMGTLPL